MNKIIITDIKNSDDFVELEVTEQAFWDCFHILEPIFEQELKTDEFNRFVGVAQGLDIQNLTDIPKAVFQKAVTALQANATLNELIKLMQADPRYAV